MARLTEEKKEMLRLRYANCRTSELQKLLGVSKHTILRNAKLMGLEKNPNLTLPPKWTAEEDKIMIEYYPNSAMNEMLLLLPNRTELAIYQRSNVLKIRKSDEFFNSENSGRLQKGDTSGRAYRFQKGHEAWNKGLKGQCAAGSEKGWFKKGNLPPNTKHDGYISIRKDNSGNSYQYIRVALGKHVQLQRHIWEQHNGKIPPKHCVIFKDGDTFNCDISNLECISMKENMKRNSLLNYPEEIRENVILTNKLIKTIRDGTEKQK